MTSTAIAANFRTANLSVPATERIRLFSHPPALLVAEDVIEDDLQRPGFQQVGDAFADNRQQSKGERFCMGTEKCR